MAKVAKNVLTRGLSGKVGNLVVFRNNGDETVLTATLNVDETKTTTVNARVSGRIDKLYFKDQGDYIKKGERWTASF